MYSSDNNNLHDDRIFANQILDLIKSLGDDKLTAFFKQMDYTEEEKILYLYQLLKITPKYDQNNKILPVSETDQLAAVNKNGDAIEYIKNPSEDVQLAAVNKKGSAIYYIFDKGIIPSEDVQLAAVNKTGSAILYIIEKGIIPSEKVQLAAVNKNGRAIQYIQNPSEKVKQLARDKGIKDV